MGLLERIAAKINKAYSLRRMSNIKAKKVPCIKTRCLGLDFALRTGGIPKGKIIELFGGESSGKTTLALIMAKSYIEAGGTVIYIDAEHALDPKYMKALGLDFDKILLSQPDTGEEGTEIAQQAMIAADPDDKLLVIIDSIASLVPKMELENPMDKETMGLQARLMSKFMRKVKGVANNSKATLLCINQIRLKIGVFWGNPETTPGGKALKFYSSVRMEMKMVKTLKRGKKKIGIRSRIRMVKNKLGAPYFETFVEMKDGEGIDCVLNTHECLKENRLLKGMGLDEIETMLEKKPKKLKKLRKKLMQR